MSEGDPIISEVSSGKLDTVKDSPKSTNKGLLDGLRRKLAIAAGVGLASGALGGVFGTQGCVPTESESDEHGHSEKVGSVQQSQWKATSFTPSWGQATGNNAAPKPYWKTPTDGIAVFVSDKDGGSNIYISTTSSGPTGPWSPEALIDDSGSVIKVNMLASTDSESGAVICVGGACATGKLIFSSDRDGSDDLFWGDFNTTTLAVTNVSKLPVGGTKVNGNATGEMYPTVDSSGNKLFFNRGYNLYTADIGVWDKTALTGAVGSLNEGPSVYGTYLIATNDTGCANVSSSLDACRYTLTGTVLSGPTNANSIVGTLAAPNDAQEQFHPYVDSQGYLWVSTGTVGNRVIKAFEPVSGGLPDAGPDGSGGEGGAGGTDGGTDSGAGGDGGTGGSDASVPDVDAGMDAAADAPDDAMDAGVDASDAGEGGVDAGPSDAGSDASEGGADSGPTDAGTDAPADSGMDASTDAGEGGPDAGPKPDCKVKVTGSASIETCNDSSATIKMTGLGSISFFDVKADITEVVGGSCTYTVDFPNIIKLTSGFCAKELSEPKTAAVKYVDSEMGITLGAEGSHKSTTAPDAFNPNKKKGVVDVVAFKAVESVHHAFKADGCDEHNLTACTPMNTNIEGAAKKNDLPEGSILYLNVKDGVVSGDPKDFKNTPSAAPVEATDGGGCNMSAENVSYGTRNAIFVLISGLLVAVRRSRRERK